MRLAARSGSGCAGGREASLRRCCRPGRGCGEGCGSRRGRGRGALAVEGSACGGAAARGAAAGRGAARGAVGGAAEKHDVPGCIAFFPCYRGSEVFYSGNSAEKHDVLEHIVLLRRASSPAISPGSYLRLKTTVGPCIPQKTGRFSPHLLQLVRKDVRKCRIARSYRYFRTSSLELSRKRSDTRVPPGYRSAAGSPPRPLLRRRVAAGSPPRLPLRRWVAALIIALLPLLVV